MKDVDLTDEARNFIRDFPSVINYFVATLGDKIDTLMLFGSSRDVRDNRLYRLRTLHVGALAAWLELELGDSVPSDWLAWLTEEVETHEPL